MVTRPDGPPGKMRSQGKTSFGLQRTCRAHSNEFAHRRAQVPSHRLNQPTSSDFLLTAQSGKSNSSCLAQMRERPFDIFTVCVAFGAVAVTVDNVPQPFVHPTLWIRSIRLKNRRPLIQRVYQLQRTGCTITLVGRGLANLHFDPRLVQLCLKLHHRIDQRLRVGTAGPTHFGLPNRSGFTVHNDIRVVSHLHRSIIHFRDTAVLAPPRTAQARFAPPGCASPKSVSLVGDAFQLTAPQFPEIQARRNSATSDIRGIAFPTTLFPVAVEASLVPEQIALAINEVSRRVRQNCGSHLHHLHFLMSTVQRDQLPFHEMRCICLEEFFRSACQQHKQQADSTSARTTCKCHETMTIYNCDQRTKGAL